MKIVVPSEIIAQGFKHFPAKYDLETGKKTSSQCYARGADAYCFCTNCALLNPVNVEPIRRKKLKRGHVSYSCSFCSSTTLKTLVDLNG